MNATAPLLACLVLVAAPVSAQPRVYPGTFPGGYPPMPSLAGSGKMYMEGYFPPPVTASPTYPAWSPDGSSIAFAYQGRIWLVPVEGGVARQLTSGPGYHSQPSWSPDDSEIAFNSYKSTKGKGSRGGVEIMSALDGSNRRLIAEGGAFPTWRR